MNSTLENHPIWHNLSETVEQLAPNQIAIQHLLACNTQIGGYWDDDAFYQVVTFTQPLHPELVSSSLGISPAATEPEHWLQLRFALTVHHSNGLEPSDRDDQDRDAKDIVGELVLVLNESLDVVDENWLVDINSPYTVARH